VAGGKFDTYKVEIVSLNDDADKQTIWIAKDSRKVVKINATLPSMGGAVLTSELVLEGIGIVTELRLIIILPLRTFME